MSVRTELAGLAAILLGLGVGVTPRQDPGQDPSPAALAVADDDDGSAENAWVPYPPDVIDRAAAGDPIAAKQLEIMTEVQGALLKFITEGYVPYKGSDSPREAALKGCNHIMVGASMAAIGQVGAGAAIGGLLQSESGAVAGIIAGGMVGTATGGATIALAAIYVSSTLPEINRRYPATSSSTNAKLANAKLVRARGDEGAVEGEVADEQAAGEEGDELAWEDPAQWDDASAGSEVIERGPSRTPYAGPQESMLIHLVDGLFHDSILELAQRWERAASARGNSQLMRLLQNNDLERVVRPHIERIAYIKKHKRLAPDAPVASPHSPFVAAFAGALMGDASSERLLQRLAGDALGMARTSVSVSSSRITWQTPRALREAGAPASLSEKLQPLYARVGPASGPSVSLKITPGPFGVDLGDVRVKDDALEISCRIKKGSTLGTVQLKGKALGVEKTIGACVPKSARDITGTVSVKLVRGVPVVQNFKVGGMSLRLDLPSLGPAFANLVKDVEKRLGRELEKLVEGKLPVGACFRELQRYFPKQMLAELNRFASAFGLTRIDAIDAIEVRNGKVTVRVKGQRFSTDAGFPATAMQQAFATMRKYATATASPRARRTVGSRRDD